MVKYLRKYLFSGINWLLAGLLSLLGFSGCNIIEPMDEYGTPFADYTVKGKVLDKSTGKPVKGVRVGYSPTPVAVPMYGVPPASYQMMSVADTTDVQGEFKLTERVSLTDEAVPIYVEDIDWAENGVYTPETLMVSFKDAERTGKPKGWYHGEYTVTVNVELEEQPTNE